MPDVNIAKEERALHGGIPPRVGRDGQADINKARAKRVKAKLQQRSKDAAMALAFSTIEHTTSRLRDAEAGAGGPVDTQACDDIDATLLMDMALREVERIRRTSYADFWDWSGDFTSVLSAINCAKRSLTNKDTEYYRTLSHLSSVVSSMTNMVEVAWMFGNEREAA